MDKKKYSVLTYNIGGYEKMHEINKDAYDIMKDTIEFIYVTDDHSITASTWNVVYADGLEGDNFDKCFQIRYNPFKYCEGDIVMKIDGSMGIERDLTPFFTYFEEGGYDIGLMSHPARMNMYDEYVTWVRARGYSIEQANKCLIWMNDEGYDVRKNVGLYQYNWMMQRRNEVNDELNGATYSLIKKLAPEGNTIDRLDQTIGSFIINRYFYGRLKAFCVGVQICADSFFKWYGHNSDKVMYINPAEMCTPYLMGQDTYFAPIW